MEIVGGGRVHVFAKEDELPHAPGSQENWQESFVIIWYDATQHVGGLFRLGHEPHYRGGRSQIFANIVAPNGVFHRTAHLPLEARHRLKNGFVSGDDTLRYEVVDGCIRWSFKDDDVEMGIEVEEFVPPIDAHRREGVPNAEGFLGAHVDAACGVSGTLTVKGRTYTIKNALAVRDHAWGPRDLDSLLSHRWTIGTFDRSNSFVAMCFHTRDQHFAKFGWVIRDGKVILADKVDIKATIGMDGATNHGGTTRMTLTTGEVFEVRFEPYYPSIASWVEKINQYDAMSRITWGKKVGFGVFETTCNLQGGTLRPELFENSYGPEGWHVAELLLADR